LLKKLRDAGVVRDLTAFAIQDNFHIRCPDFPTEGHNFPTAERLF